MRRVIAPALLALFVFAGNANAGFGLFDRLCNRGCDAAPACDSGCGMIAEPVCGCEVAPTCGCEIVDPCCAPRPKFGGLLKKLFHKNRGCDAAPCCDVAPVCEPACGCEVAPMDCGCAVIEPACGCEVAPTCGCEAAPARRPLFGCLKKLFRKDTGCCDPCAAPVCEPVCGFEPSCGCGM